MSEQAEKEILLGKVVLNHDSEKLSGGFIDIDGETFYKISRYNQMDPFFITIVSNSDHWMFLSSNGGITAGRKNPDNALFPYYTVDKIQDSAEVRIFIKSLQSRSESARLVICCSALVFNVCFTFMARVP